MVRLPIYMDCHATTPVDPAVLSAMLPFFTEQFGNASSRQHQYGWSAEAAVEAARASVARCIGAEPREVIFTSGATESNNLALKGTAAGLQSKGNHIVIAQTEHKSVIDPARQLEKNGYQVTYLPVDSQGMIDLDQLKSSITPKTILVSVMAANNEIGTLQPVDEIGRLCRERQVCFHTDASQAVGKIPVDVTAFSADLMSLTAHKIFGPKGIGALYVRSAQPKFRLVPQMDGGGHERGWRSGTLNVPGIVGFGKAAELARAYLPEESGRVRQLRDRLQHALMAQLDEVCLNGHPSRRLPNNLNLSFLHVEDSVLMMSMKDIAVSTGSACSTADPEPSHVLKALHLPPERLHSSIRFGLGRFTTSEEIDIVIERVVASVRQLREQSLAYRQSRRTPIPT
jgi:cysteine desulfurase